MRLLKTFDEIYVMDLHGAAGQRCPDGSFDYNVFDIKEGVSILIGVKHKSSVQQDDKKLSKVFYYDLWGKRQEKYDFLSSTDVESVEWQEIQPSPSNYFFAPKDFSLGDEYDNLCCIDEILCMNAAGVKTRRDHLYIDYDRSTLVERFEDIATNPNITELESKYQLGESDYWKLSKVKKYILEDEVDIKVVKYLYRPFDNVWIYYNPNIIEKGDGRWNLMQHILKPNLTLILCRQQKEIGFHHCFTTEFIGDGNAISIHSREYNYYFPLYQYLNISSEDDDIFGSINKIHNLSNDFLKVVREKLGYIPTPEAIFYYIYAIFHSPTYRQRYAEFLKIDFPRVPITSNDQLFRNLSGKGQELVDLHLMKSKKLNKLITKMGGNGDNTVTEVTYKSTEQRVYINQERYFQGISPEVWEFKIGGYQVLDKWLKDRKKAKRTLSFDDVLHYQKIVVALKETMQVMIEIDQFIPSFPIE